MHVYVHSWSPNDSDSNQQNNHGTAQRQLDARTRVVGSTPEGDISTGMQLPTVIFPVLSKAWL